MFGALCRTKKWTSASPCPFPPGSCTSLGLYLPFIRHAGCWNQIQESSPSYTSSSPPLPTDHPKALRPNLTTQHCPYHLPCSHTPTTPFRGPCTPIILKFLRCPLHSSVFLMLSLKMPCPHCFPCKSCPSHKSKPFLSLDPLHCQTQAKCGHLCRATEPDTMCISKPMK